MLCFRDSRVKNAGNKVFGAKQLFSAFLQQKEYQKYKTVRIEE